VKVLSTEIFCHDNSQNQFAMDGVAGGGLGETTRPEEKVAGHLSVT
jgi:hypothetical protein